MNVIEGLFTTASQDVNKYNLLDNDNWIKGGKISTLLAVYSLNY